MSDRLSGPVAEMKNATSPAEDPDPNPDPRPDPKPAPVRHRIEPAPSKTTMPDAKPTIEQVLAASATHPELRASLLADPRAALRRFGIEIRVVENTPEVLHLALPPASSPVESDDLSDE